jgi:hypothetical protein
VRSPICARRPVSHSSHTPHRHIRFRRTTKTRASQNHWSPTHRFCGGGSFQDLPYFLPDRRRFLYSQESNNPFDRQKVTVTNEQMNEFARAGAQARLQAISEERAAIIRMFPDRRTRTAPSSLDGPAPASRARKRRRMSAAERKAVGRRMKAYWAKRGREKAGAKKAAPKPNRKGGMSAEARKRQGERMRAYWAARRLQKQAGAESAAPTEAIAAGTSSPAKTRRRAGREAGAKSL